MRAVHAAYEANAVKYQSAGRGRKAARVQKVLRVLRFDAPIARGLWYAPSKKKGAIMIKPYNRALGAKGKQANLASLVGNAPLSPPAAVLLLKGSMSLDFRVVSLPYKSSSFATPEGEVLVMP